LTYNVGAAGSRLAPWLHTYLTAADAVLVNCSHSSLAFEASAKPGTALAKLTSDRKEAPCVCTKLLQRIWKKNARKNNPNADLLKCEQLGTNCRGKICNASLL
jgi:hypothetical protein